MLGISQGKNKYCTILLFVGIDRKASYGIVFSLFDDKPMINEL